MKAVSARATKGLNIGSVVFAADNAGARIVRICSIKGGKARKKRQLGAKIADWVKVSVREGKPDMKGQVFDAVVIRVKKPYRRNCYPKAGCLEIYNLPGGYSPPGCLLRRNPGRSQA